MTEQEAGTFKIVAVNKNDQGEIQEVKLDDGNIITKEEAIQAAAEGKISNITVAHRGDTQYLRTYPDGTDANNLDNLPEFD